MQKILGLATAVAVLGIAAAGCKDEDGASPGKPAGDNKEPPADTTRPSVPEDFALRYVAGPVHADWGDELDITLAADDKGGFALLRTASEPRRGSRPGWKRTSEPVPVPRDKVLAIYQEVVRQRFFELNDTYRSPTAMDGNTMSLEVTANGKTKQVRVTNTEVPQVSAILALLPPPPPPPPRPDEENDGGPAPE